VLKIKQKVIKKRPSLQRLLRMTFSNKGKCKALIRFGCNEEDQMSLRGLLAKKTWQTKTVIQWPII